MAKMHDECGVFGIYSSEDWNVATSVYYGLFALQHRGQESCGIVVNKAGKFKAYKDVGLVNDVFTPSVIENLGDGNIAVGHVRYGTAETGGRVNAQPIVINHVKGSMALANNGSIVNAIELRRELELEGAIFHTHSDAEVISYIITRERIKCNTIEEAASRAMDKIKGSYTLVIMTGAKLMAIRDKHGIRPLCYGITPDGDYVVASESCALDAAGAEFVRDIEPGEIVTFGSDGVRSFTEHCGKEPKAACVFEYIYFARPDSVIDGCSVHDARLRAGAYLALEHPVAADIVIGVPDSGIDAAIGYARQSGIPYGVGLIKNKYIGRTFIVPGQKTREDKVRIKLNPLSAVVKGKRVVIIDDSIVRGTTGARIIKLLREAGASEVHMRISAPPFVEPCYYGTDIDSKDALIACHHTIDEIAKIMGVDSLGYLSLDSAKKIAHGSGCTGFCTACFDGKYPTDIPSAACKSEK